jgi:curli biogenesis system outer membrane secretion channel CsgG
MLALPVLLAACVQDPLPGAAATPLAAEPIVLPPAPKHVLNVGIYDCMDTTGQKRPTGAAQELSSAVPLDCTPYMVEAVLALTPGYIYLVEREHVEELLRERQLATVALNSAVPPPGAPPAPPRRLSILHVAEVLLIGQVVAYDRETRQVSGGIALGGLGFTGTLVTDQVTFSLRAVAVQTGEIIGQSTVTKSITSQTVGGHITRVWPTTILDAELGGATNEAVGLAMREAVHGSLMKLIDQGLHDGWWA